MELKKLLQSGESERVEFKRTFGKEVVISLCAFANRAVSEFMSQKLD